MVGHIFKNFYLCKLNLIFLGVMQALVSASIVVELCLAGDNAKENYGLFEILLYACMFFLTAFSFTEYFSCDERQSWVGFVASTPRAERGHIAGKYITILILNTAVLLCVFLTYTAASVIMGEFSPEIARLILAMYGVETIICAYEMIFYIRFGSQSGSNVKGVVLGTIIMTLMVYFLFGDISFLYTDSPLEEIARFLNSPVPKWICLLLPIASLGLYALSYVISLRLYRKGSENYGE